LFRICPTACAVGCILAPLRGYGENTTCDAYVKIGWQEY